MSLKLEIQKVAQARQDITGHSGGTATEFHRVPLTMQSNIRDKDERQGASLSIADMIYLPITIIGIIFFKVFTFSFMFRNLASLLSLVLVEFQRDSCSASISG